MAIIKYNNKEIDTLARLMRAEALDEGELGMLMVGKLIENVKISLCYGRTVEDACPYNFGWC